MTMETTRILVIGAGVNGSICATGLFKAGFNVTVLARGRRYEELTDQGIVIEDPYKGTRSITKVPVIDALAPDDCYEYVLVIVRKNQVADLLPVLSQNRSPNVVFMINNPSGPEIYTRALGTERVMLGFVFGAGRREGSLIRAIGGPGTSLGTTSFGEINGEITPRLSRLIAILHQAGFRVKASRRMVDSLATHAALVAPIGRLLLQYGCDNYALARSSSDLRLLAAALGEVLPVLQANGFAIEPAGTGFIFRVLPRPLLVIAFRLFLPTRFAEIGAAWHCSQAPDEIHQLGVELMALVDRSGLSAPALRKLFAAPSEED